MWVSVATRFVSWRSAQKPPVIRTSPSPSGRRTDELGTTGRPPVDRLVVVVTEFLR